MVINMKKMWKRLSAIFLATTLLLNSSVFATPAPAPVYEDMLLDVAKPILEAYAQHYDISNVKISIVEEASTKSGGNRVEYYVEFVGQLKYSSATELPQVRGLAAAFNVDSQTLTTEEFAETLKSPKTLLAVMQTVSTEAFTLMESMSADDLEILSEFSGFMNTFATPSISSEKIVANAIAEIATTNAVDFVENIEKLYIGSSSHFNVGILAEFDRNGILIDTQYADFDGYTDDISIVVPAPIEDMLELGTQQARAYVTDATKIVSNINALSSSLKDANPLYYKVEARDYVNAYTSNASVGTCANPNCTNYGSSIRMDTRYYNSDYTWYHCNDCANFVSQGMYAGGIPTDDTWKPGAKAWIVCQNMLNYFTTTKGWWTESDIARAAAGEIIMMYNKYGVPYHVVMIVLNDTITRQFSGHTNDRLQHNYSTSTTFNASYVKFYRFSNYTLEYKP